LDGVARIATRQATNSAKTMLRVKDLITWTKHTFESPVVFCLVSPAVPPCTATSAARPTPVSDELPENDMAGRIYCSGWGSASPSKGQPSELNPGAPAEISPTPSRLAIPCHIGEFDAIQHWRTHFRAA